MPDNLVLTNSAFDLVEVICVNGEDKQINDGTTLFFSGLQLNVGKRIYYIGVEFDIKADPEAVTVLYGNMRKQRIRVLLARTKYNTIAELKTALMACKSTATIQEVTTELVSGNQLVVTVNGVSSDPLPLPGGDNVLQDYSGGNNSWIWATGTGVTLTKTPGSSLYTITIPDGINPWKVEVIGTVADTNGSVGDLNVLFDYQGTRTFNQDNVSAKKPSVQISNGDYGSISPGSPSMVNPNLLYGVSSVGSGDLQVTIINASGYYTTFKLTFLMP